MVSVYKRGTIWWVQYYHGGKYSRESSGSKLKRDANDFRNRIIRLKPGETKNDEARVVYMNDELRDELKAQKKTARSQVPILSPRLFQPQIRKAD